MDIFIIKLAALIVGPLIVMAFVLYSISLIREVGVAVFSKQIIKLGKVFVTGVGSLVMSVVALLTVKNISSENEERRLHDSDLSGELNYRTGVARRGNRSSRMV